jgi:hypothetical protein
MSLLPVLNQNLNQMMFDNQIQHQEIILIMGRRVDLLEDELLDLQYNQREKIRQARIQKKKMKKEMKMMKRKMRRMNSLK